MSTVRIFHASCFYCYDETSFRIIIKAPTRQEAPEIGKNAPHVKVFNEVRSYKECDCGIVYHSLSTN